MVRIFTACFVLLLGLSLVAFFLNRQKEGSRLLWAVDANDIRKAQVEFFKKENPATTLSLDPSQPDTSKIIVQCLGGVGPDLFCAYSPTQLSAYVKSGMALDITDEIRKTGIDFSKDVWSGAFPCSIYEGRVYGVPNNVAVEGLWYNKDAFDEAGLPYPAGDWTWEEFLNVAKALVKRNNDGKIIRFGFSFEWSQWPHFVKQWGGRFFSKDGTRCLLDSPETISAVSFMRSLIYEHHVSPTPIEESGMSSAGGWGSGTINYFCAGKYAMALGGRWWLISLRRYKDLRYGPCQSPHGARKIFLSYGKSTLINSNSPRRKEALEFLKFMLGHPYNNLINEQGDGVGPVKAFCQIGDDGKSNPLVADMPVWEEMMSFSEPLESSPFVNGEIAMRIVGEQLDLVKANRKTPEDAMRKATELINREMIKGLKYDRKLRERYEHLTGRRIK